MAKSNKNIYLDYAASVEANPSSIHTLGIEAKKELEKARIGVANVLSARPTEIIFTSGGTESNNLAIQGVVFGCWTPDIGKLHIITTNIEHPSVLETYRMLERRGLVEISIIPVERNGIVDPKKIKKEIKENTILVSVMYANNEIGTIQPIKEIAKEIRHFRKTQNLTPSPISLIRRGVGERCIYPLFHTDAVQAVNYLDLNVEKLGVDLLSLSGTKIEGAGRVGVLYKRKSVPLSAIFGGGDQEIGLRPGTENLKEIIKFSNALKLIQKNKDPASTRASLGGKENKRLIKLRDYFLKKLNNQGNSFPSREGISLIINGDLENRLPNNINITFPKIPSNLLVIELSEKGIMASSKSACKSSQKGGSYVIEAIRHEVYSEIGGLRFSLGKDTTKADIDYTIKTLSKILQKLNKWYQ